MTEPRPTAADFKQADAEGFSYTPVVDHTGVYERCVQCRREYRYPHVCREHHLCGLCHPEMKVG